MLAADAVVVEDFRASSDSRSQGHWWEKRWAENNVCSASAHQQSTVNVLLNTTYCEVKLYGSWEFSMDSPEKKCPDIVTPAPSV